MSIDQIISEEAFKDIPGQLIVKCFFTQVENENDRWLCMLCPGNKLLSQKQANGYTNLRSHVYHAHRDCVIERIQQFKESNANNDPKLTGKRKYTPSSSSSSYSLNRILFPTTTSDTSINRSTTISPSTLLPQQYTYPYTYKPTTNKINTNFSINYTPYYEIKKNNISMKLTCIPPSIIRTNYNNTTNSHITSSSSGSNSGIHQTQQTSKYNQGMLRLDFINTSFPYLLTVSTPLKSHHQRTPSPPLSSYDILEPSDESNTYHIEEELNMSPNNLNSPPIKLNAVTDAATTTVITTGYQNTPTDIQIHTQTPTNNNVTLHTTLQLHPPQSQLHIHPPPHSHSEDIHIHVDICDDNIENMKLNLLSECYYTLDITACGRLLHKLQTSYSYFQQYISTNYTTNEGNHHYRADMSKLEFIATSRIQSHTGTSSNTSSGSSHNININEANNISMRNNSTNYGTIRKKLTLYSRDEDGWCISFTLYHNQDILYQYDIAVIWEDIVILITLIQYCIPKMVGFDQLSG